MTDPNIQAILDEMWQAWEEARQAQQQNMQLLTNLVAHLAIPPYNPNDNQNHNNPPSRDRNWDSGLRVKIPNFSRSLKLEEFLDWTHTRETSAPSYDLFSRTSLSMVAELQVPPLSR
jgi:hypothetical protein